MANQGHIVMKMATEPAKAESVPAYASRKLRARVPAKVQGRRERSGSRVHRFVAERDFKGASGPMLPASLGAQMKPRPISLRLPSTCSRQPSSPKEPLARKLAHIAKKAPRHAVAPHLPMALLPRSIAAQGRFGRLMGCTDQCTPHRRDSVRCDSE